MLSSLTNGTYTFTLGNAECYKLFLLDEDDVPVVSSSDFNVCNFAVSSVKNNYSVGETVEISFDYCGSTSEDYVVIYDCDGDYITWDYTDGSDAGKVSIASSTTTGDDVLTAGCYVGELYLYDDTYIGSSEEFNVN